MFAKVTVTTSLFSLASAALDWQACSDLNRQISAENGVQGTPFECATLQVPLDYTLNDSQPLDLSLFRVKATKQPAQGTVLINFGGPGATGALNLSPFARQLAVNIGEEWNLLAWDPRGTGKTLPFSCGLTQLGGVGTNVPRQEEGEMAFTSANLTDFFVNGGWNYAGQIARTCATATRQTGGDLIGTAFSARDMIRIVDALDEDGLLRYYGLSYGTTLGAYVAAMFPERIERVVLDGNVNPHDYQSGTWGDFLIDADKAYFAFTDECFKNENDCALARYANATDAMDIRNVLDQAIRPLAISAPSRGLIGWLTYATVIQILFQQLYNPASWPQLAELIVSFLDGSYVPPTNMTTPANRYDQGAPWSTIGIRASDALYNTNSSAEYLPTVRYQDTTSSFDISYISTWISARWSVPAKERYRGNFTATTKHPIFFVNGEFDPVAPLASAYNASAGFAGSVVLPHSGYGHTLLAHPSECVARYIRAYFVNGTLPPSDVQCAPDMGAWELARATAANQTNLPHGGGIIGGDNNNNTTNNGNNGAGGTNGAGQRTVSVMAVVVSVFAFGLLL